MSEESAAGIPPDDPDEAATGVDEAQSESSPEVYEWYQNGLSLLAGGNADAAAQVLERAVLQEPESASLREAWARALFDARRYDSAAEQFGFLAHRHPHDDYARFGLGLTRYRLGDVEGAAEHLAMAVTMRPDRQDYVRALKEARATLRAREERQM